MKAFVTLFVILITVPSQAQWNKKIRGNGETSTETRKLSPYEALQVHGSFDVELVGDNTTAITIKSEKKLLPYIITEVKDNTLIIKTAKRKDLYPSKGNSIKITLPGSKLNHIALNGSGDITGKVPLKGDLIRLKINGSGDLRVAVEASRVEAKVTGSGDMDIQGNTHSFDASVTGSGDLNAHDLISQNCDANIVGSGDISTNVKEKLYVKIIGSGDVEVNRDVAEIEEKIVGSGDVSRR